MSGIPHHTSDLICAFCEQKLTQADPVLVKWFHDSKVKYPDIHVSWSYRDKDSQEEAYSVGATHLHYPDSQHNKLPSQALDIFQINDAGKAIWNPVFFAKLDQENQDAHLPIKWGGNWRSLSDTDHFELASFSKSDNNIAS